MMDLPQPEAPYRLMAMAQRGIAMDEVIIDRMERLVRDANDVTALMDLSLILQFYGQREQALSYQSRALDIARLFVDPVPKAAALRLLCLAAPGDLTVNMPVELMVQGRDVTIFKLYLKPGEALPDRLPDHDAVLVLISEYDETRGLLTRLATQLESWPRPVINHPKGILPLCRDRIVRLLENVPGLAVPGTVRWDADTIAEIILDGLLDESAFPLIIRPVGTHGGKGVEKVADVAALGQYIQSAKADHFYVSPFVDYRSADGWYRKYRIALIDGLPYLCHLAIADQWLVHYAKAGMEDQEWKREEEGNLMQTFDLTFVARHADAFQELAQRLALDFVVIDCAETPDGQLLFFEADNAGAVHDLDPPDVFPYKPAQMRRIFDAFHGLMINRLTMNKDISHHD